jgi:hypothetical protein
MQSAICLIVRHDTLGDEKMEELVSRTQGIKNHVDELSRTILVRKSISIFLIPYFLKSFQSKVDSDSARIFEKTVY